jgi:hypothetical protein
MAADTDVPPTARGKLKRHGLPDADLAADLPAPILADLLGLNIQTATVWARHAGTDWTAYLSARIDTTTPPGQEAAFRRADHTTVGGRSASGEDPGGGTV